jgi:hypothetical protein
MNGSCEIVLKRDAGREKCLGDDFRFCFEAEFNPKYANGNLTRIHNTDGGGEDYNMEFDALNRLVRYYEDTAGEKGIFSYNCAGLLAGREVDGDITKFGYDVYSVLDMITKANGDELGFDFDILGRLRGYGTDSRESTFNYDGTKRFGDFDDGWKRYHWCKSQFLGYEDDANTFYIVPDIDGSTKVIFTHAGTIVNRLDYDQLGKIRNQDTTPQVELLWRGMFYLPAMEAYVFLNSLSYPTFGIGLNYKLESDKALIYNDYFVIRISRSGELFRAGIFGCSSAIEYYEYVCSQYDPSWDLTTEAGEIAHERWLQQRRHAYMGMIFWCYRWGEWVSATLKGFWVEY